MRIAIYLGIGTELFAREHQKNNTNLSYLRNSRSISGRAKSDGSRWNGLDMPDSKANARVFGYPGSRKGTRAAFPKVRVVLLIEAGTHLSTWAKLISYSHIARASF